MKGVKLLPCDEKCVREVLRESPRMSEATKPSPKGSDWTRLLTDPDLVSHLGKLLQTYREVSPEEREPALLRAMREIKDAAVKAREARTNVSVAAVAAAPAMLQHPEPIDETPPFEPDLFTPQLASDRRRFTGSNAIWRGEFTFEGGKSRGGAIWGM